MDNFGIPRGNIRASALEKLAKLSVETPSFVPESNGFDGNGYSEIPFDDDFCKILAGVKLVDISSVPMSQKEFEIILALSESTKVMTSESQAKLLFKRVSPYFLESATQKFTNHILLTATPTPWSVLTRSLTSMVVRLGLKFPQLFGASRDLILQYIERLSESQREFSHYFSLIGFLEALCEEPEFLTSESGFDCMLQIHYLLNTSFISEVERYSGIMFTERNDFQFFLRYHVVTEFGAFLFLQLFSNLMVKVTSTLLENKSGSNLIEYLLEISAAAYDKFDEDSVSDVVESPKLLNGYVSTLSDVHTTILKTLSEIAIGRVRSFDEEDFSGYFTTQDRLSLAFSAKAKALEVIGAGVYIDNVKTELGVKIFKGCLALNSAMLDAEFGPTVFSFGSLLCFKDSAVGGTLTRAFWNLISHPHLSLEYTERASHSLGLACKCLSQDTVVSTIYTMTNILAVDADGTPRKPRNTLTINSLGATESHAEENNNTFIQSSRVGFPYGSGTDSASSLNGSFNQVRIRDGPIGKEPNADNLHLFKNIVAVVSNIVRQYGDMSVSTLSVTILSQKLRKSSKELDYILLDGLASVAPFVPEREFLILLRLFNTISSTALKEGHTGLVEAVTNARVQISKSINRNHALYEVYLREILDSMISRGDVQVLEHHRSHNEISEIGRQIALYFKPLAQLLPEVYETPAEFADPEIVQLFKNIWFNMVVHGYSDNSVLSLEYRQDLERIAWHSPPLASEKSWNRTETSIELNTVLRRGSSNHNLRDQKQIIEDFSGINLLEMRTISYSKLMFLSATIFLETLRVRTGDCSKILLYYSDPSVETTGMDKYIGFIAFALLKKYIAHVNFGGKEQFVADNVAQQLTVMLTLCCHRLEELQDTAIQCCDVLISKIPSALCHHKSLFTLLDILTILFDSVVDAEASQYDPQTVFSARRSGISLSLTDSYSWRKSTLNQLHKKATHWVKSAYYKCNQDMKSLFQAYVSEVGQFQRTNKVELGVSFSLDMAGSVLSNERELSHITLTDQKPDTLAGFLSQFSWRSSFRETIMHRITSSGSNRNVQQLFVAAAAQIEELNERLAIAASDEEEGTENDAITAIETCAILLFNSDKNSAELVRHIVDIPFKLFSSSIMKIGISIWLTVMKERPDLSVLLLSEIAKHWELSIKSKIGLFSHEHDLELPEFVKMEYAPSDKKRMNRLATATSKALSPHLNIIRLLSSHFQATMHQSDHILKMFTRIAFVGLKGLNDASYHPFSRLPRFELIKLAISILQYHVALGSRIVNSLTEAIVDASLSWFRQRATFPFGSNMLKVKADYDLLHDIARHMGSLNIKGNTQVEIKRSILVYFLDSEISNVCTWLSPRDPNETAGMYLQSSIDESKIRNAYAIDPILAINLAHRYQIKHLDELLKKLLIEKPLPAIHYPDAVQFLVGIGAGSPGPSYQLLYWNALAPVDAITLFLPPFGSDPFVLQYTMRSLESHDVNLTFFYVPQIVQSVRYDARGYVERFIVETAKVSQLFAHQIIWNMLANSYKDEEASDPDAIKPSLDRIQKKMTETFSQEDLSFFKKEFGFFNEVTDISGKLKPFIKSTKAEKKEKIDEEMAKIKVEQGVYLPSNPDGVVIDINRTSGRPLQSHAKAPFMATFKIKKELEEVDEHGKPTSVEIEKWQSAIFKVGDDCRQDVLALQLISVFRTIWADTGLDLYVFPYRVTATAPGCGVIDVLPNSVSRDMLGREAVNGLYEYFTSKFGPENTIEFQQARNNFIKSLAAYSIISYLIQFKDRHNGNIMYDDQGHILHIDFGFCFDIVPGGVRFEAAPFKLTKEMVMVMGGSKDTQAFRWFEDLCVKGYLACRPYMETIVRCVTPMLDSGLPCFKEQTIKKLRSRFTPKKSEKEAVEYMRGLVKKSFESVYTRGYDEFQRITNGIPY